MFLFFFKSKLQTVLSLFRCFRYSILHLNVACPDYFVASCRRIYTGSCSRCVHKAAALFALLTCISGKFGTLGDRREIYNREGPPGWLAGSQDHLRTVIVPAPELSHLKKNYLLTCQIHYKFLTGIRITFITFILTHQLLLIESTKFLCA